MSIILFCLVVIVAFVASQFIWIKVTGTPVPVPDISREIQTFGEDSSQSPNMGTNTTLSQVQSPLRYAVLGDSTSISQGGEYARGYAYKSAEHLAKTHQVTWVNFGISGARAKDIADTQAKQAVAFRPDVALIAVGANDVTHLTSTAEVEKHLMSAIDQLRASNPSVKVVLTGSPDMGSVPRLPQPTRWLAGKRTEAVNRMVRALCAKENLAFAPIAEQTGPYFRKHPELFAADKFHPLAEGYDLWTPIIIKALDEALAS